jgi:2-iminobutanoate/2-iminopropanoate deaminase
MSDVQVIKTDKAPAAIGPYSIGMIYGNLIFTAGQLGIDPDSGEIVQGGIEEETRQALTNISNILEQAGSSLSNVLKTTVFLRDMNDFQSMNAVYSKFFTENFPARSTLQVAAVPKFAAVEIEAIAYIE